MTRPSAALTAALAGPAAAVLHLAGALKSLPGVEALPVDLTALALLLALPSLALLLPLRRWTVHRGLAVPLAALAVLLPWLVVAGAWSPARAVLAEKLPQVVLLGPAMLFAGLVVGADPPTLRRFAHAVLAIGLTVGAVVAWGVVTDSVVLGGRGPADPARLRVQYQLAGLAIACAGGLAAVRLVEARSGGARLLWGALVLALALAVLVPGGRAAGLALGLAVLLAPALRLWLDARPRAMVAWVALVTIAGALGVGALLLMPAALDDLRTLERLFGEPASATPARYLLWDAALRWGGLAAPFGLGTGAFTIAAGSGDERALHPHNHALEMLAEAGLPGLGAWLAAFGGGALLALRHAPRAGGWRAARIAALTLPLALTAMVSTDSGNRMIWFGLGLALSLAVSTARRDA